MARACSSSTAGSTTSCRSASSARGRSPPSPRSSRRRLEARRSRPNLLVEPTDDGAFAEDAWVGVVLRIGGLRTRVDQRDKRCVMVNVDPDTTARDPEVLRAIARERRSCLGVYGSTVQPGRVAVGDPVVLVAPRR
jgi:hypothetical protein